jgi:hypothetical protein
MSFRQPKVDHQRRSTNWRHWIDKNRTELIAIGLPPEVHLDESHWLDFLENGHMHWHDSSGFEFGQLLPEQLAALLRFLEREYGESSRRPALLNWVRVRCGKS